MPPKIDEPIRAATTQRPGSPLISLSLLEVVSARARAPDRAARSRVPGEERRRQQQRMAQRRRERRARAGAAGRRESEPLPLYRVARAPCSESDSLRVAQPTRNRALQPGLT